MYDMTSIYWVYQIRHARVLFSSAFATGLVVGMIASVTWQILLLGRTILQEPMINGLIFTMVSYLLMWVSLIPGWLSNIVAQSVGGYPYIKFGSWALIVTGFLCAIGIFLVVRGNFGPTPKKFERMLFFGFFRF